MTNSTSIQSQYEQDIEKVESWWKEEKQKHLKRPYSAATVAALRNSIEISYPSSIQAIKLWDLFNKYHESQTPMMTFGAVDPILASQMSRAGIETVYVSGAMCGLSQVQEAGMDHADYPWDTVPKAVEKIFKSQLWHDRRQRQYIMHLPESDREKYPQYDYMLPIIADADMGFGGITTIMKMTKAFVEAGVAMFHLDDLAIGVKKFTAGVGRTVVPTSEFLKRLTAARLQLDMMGAETLIMSRVDAYHAEFISSVIDARDHPYVLGATNPDIEPLVAALNKATVDGKDTRQARLDWLKEAKVMTYDQAVKSQFSEPEYDEYMQLVNEKPIVSLVQRRQFASSVSKDVFFDWDKSRSSTGQYLFKPTTECLVGRAKASLDISDTTWARMDSPIWKDIVDFHIEMRKVVPERVFGFGYVDRYDFAKAGFSEEQVKNLQIDLAKMGIIWQVQPIFAIQGINMFTCKFAEMWKKEGIHGYIRDIQNESLSTKPIMVDGFSTPWSGAYLADKFLDAADSYDLDLITE